MQIGDVT